MLAANSAVVNYLRRTALDPIPPGVHLIERLTELARREVTQLRATGFASITRPESSQVIDVMVRQLGHLFLQPMIDAMWRQLAEPGATDTDKPILEIEPAAHRGQPAPQHDRRPPVISAVVVQVAAPGSRLRVAIFAVVLSGEAREAVPVDLVAGGGRGRAVGAGYEGGGAAAVFHPDSFLLFLEIFC
jgi:hypothetical protein